MKNWTHLDLDHRWSTKHTRFHEKMASSGVLSTPQTGAQPQDGSSKPMIRWFYWRTATMVLCFNDLKTARGSTHGTLNTREEHGHGTTPTRRISIDIELLPVLLLRASINKLECRCRLCQQRANHRLLRSIDTLSSLPRGRTHRRFA